MVAMPESHQRISWRASFISTMGIRLVARRREDYTRLGFAIQLGTARFLGTFRPDPTDVPSGIVLHMSRQLHITDPACLPRYLEEPAPHALRTRPSN